MKVAPKFETMDLESCSGRYHTVCCLDVMIHYPTDKMEGMVQHLASLAGAWRECWSHMGGQNCGWNLTKQTQHVSCPPN